MLNVFFDKFLMNERLGFFFLLNLKLSHISFTIPSDFIIAFFEIPGQTNKIRIELVVFHAVGYDEFYVGINLIH